MTSVSKKTPRCLLRRIKDSPKSIEKRRDKRLKSFERQSKELNNKRMRQRSKRLDSHRDIVLPSDKVDGDQETSISNISNNISLVKTQSQITS